MISVSFIILIYTFCNALFLEDIVMVDDFEDHNLDDWRSRRKGFEEIYTIKEKDGNSYLSATSLNSDNLIVKRVYVDLKEYPYLNWKWRANTLPENGNESVKEYCDVPASIAVVLNRSRILPKSIKYSWSSTLPENLITKSPYSKWPAKCDIVVVESGEANKGKWVTEKHNVMSDFSRFYKKSKKKRKDVFAIVIMTDSDNTSTLSSADYDDIYFSKN